VRFRDLRFVRRPRPDGVKSEVDRFPSLTFPLAHSDCCLFNRALQAARTSGIDAVDGSFHRRGSAEGVTTTRKEPMKTVATIGLDIAMSDFQVHGIDWR
jgi:hypothetical protein